MTDDSVSVQFGAQTGELVSGVDQVKGKLDELSAKGSSVADSFKEMGKLLVEAFAVEKIVEMIDKMSELGEQIERTAQMTGLSTDAVQQFQFAMKMTGGEAESAAITIERLERNMLTASTGTGNAAKAFKALGINVKDADGQIRPVQDILGDLAEKFAGTEDGATKTYYAMTLMGRGGAQLIPVLNKGRDGLAELNAQFENTNARLAPDQVKALAELHQGITTLETAWQGLKELFVADLAPMFTSMIGFVTQLISLFKSADDAVKSFTAGLADMANSARNAIAASGLGKYVGLGGNVVDTSKLGHVETPGEAASIPDQNKLQEQLNQQLQQLNLVKKSALPTPDGGAKGQETQLQQWKDQLTQQLTEEQNFFADSKKEELDFWEEKLQYTKDGSRDRLAIETQVYQLQKQLAQEDLQDQLATIKAKQEAVKDDFNAVIALEQQKLAILKQDYGEDSRQYQAALREKEAMDLAHNKKEEDGYKKTFDSITASFDQMLSGVLQGTQTWQQALQKLFSNMAATFIEALAKMALQWAAFEAATSAGWTKIAAGIGNPFSPSGSAGSSGTSQMATLINSLTAELGLNTAAQTAGTATTAANTGAQVAQVGENSLETVSNTGAIIANTAAVSASGATSGGGGIFSFLSAAASVASFDVGTSYVPQTGLALIHQGEMILPADVASGVRSGGGFGGGDNYNITIQAIDTQTGAQFLKNNAKTIAQAISGQVRNFSPSLPGWKPA